MVLYPSLPQLKGKRIIITAGPTIEPIDPVRYIANRSSGKTGYAIANTAAGFGAKVMLISGPTKLPTPYEVEQKNVTTAQEMRDVVIDTITKYGCDIFIATAAVADYRVENPYENKIKKITEIFELRLVKNPDILAEVAKKRLATLVIGFAAETKNVISYAKEKLIQKNLDLVVANEVGQNKGFETDNNAFIVITKDGHEISIKQNNKIVLAMELMKVAANYMPHDYSV